VYAKLLEIILAMPRSGNFSAITSNAAFFVFPSIGKDLIYSIVARVIFTLSAGV